MLSFLVRARRRPRVLGAVAALLMGSILAGQRAEAMSPLNPAMPVAGKAASERTIEVRGGHGGGGGGGGHFGGGAGRGFTGGAFSGAVVRGGAIGVAPAAVAGGPRYAGRPFFHHHHHFHGVLIGGVYYDDYPYDYPDYYDYPPAYPVATYVAGGGCRRVLTAYGPRVVCHHRGARHYRRIHRRHHQRRHHHA
jgi:hypothetical protein